MTKPASTLRGLERKLAKKREADRASFDEALEQARRFRRPVEIQTERVNTVWEAHEPSGVRYTVAERLEYV